MKKFSIPSIIRLVLLTIILSLFFACSSSSDKKEETIKDEWIIPTQYQNIPIEQIKSQIEITEYKTMKGAATNAGTELMTREGYNSLIKGGGKVPAETPKNKADREALAAYINKLISLEGVIKQYGTQKNSPLDIKEREPGKYEIWFCADKNQARKPCRYRAFLLYEGPEGKGKEIFTKENVIKIWGVILGEEIIRLNVGMGEFNYKRYPRI